MKGAAKCYVLAAGVLFAMLGKEGGAAWGGQSAIKLSAQGVSSRSEMLFTVTADSGGTVYSTLFSTNEPCAPLQPLTFYPERMELLSDGRFQVRSRYGTALYDTNTSLLKCGTIGDIPSITMRLSAVSPSPNGKWACYVKRTGISEGYLVLKNTVNGKEYILDDKSTFTYEKIPVKWAKEGEIFVYSKNGFIYFCDPVALSRSVQIDEHYRTIGRGDISSVQWASYSLSSINKGGALYYIEGDTINVISQKGLYTQVIYADILGHGKPCGRLPYKFDDKYDTFSVRDDGEEIAVLKGGSLLSVYNIHSGAQLLTAKATVQVSDAKNPLIEAVLMWGRSGDLLAWTNVMPWGGKERAVVHRIGEESKVVMQEEGTFHAPILSPNGRRAAFYDDKSLRVCDTDNWQVLGKYTSERIASAIWDGNYAMYLGGESTVSRWIVGDSAAEVLFPSSAKRAVWQEGKVETVCPNGKVFSASVPPSKDGIHWQKKDDKDAMQIDNALPVLQNGHYRMFSSSSSNALFSNALYVRDLRGNGSTHPVFASAARALGKKREVALAIDAYTSCDSLSGALHTLKAFGVKATVFINGAFIARYKDETRSIANSGASCASLFFADTDLSGGSFIADREFIMRGLSRNEDEFFRVTGKELLPLWHAPRYKADNNVREAGEDAGYKYIDAIHLDSEDDSVDLLIREVENSKMNTLSITLGTPIVERLDVLIGALLDAGYEIVGAEEL